MRYLVILAVALITSCSWSWPWGKTRTGNCVDTDSCDEANPFEEKLVGGTWYCYGVSRDQPWECSRQADPAKIAAVGGDPAPARVDPNPLVPSHEGEPERAVLYFEPDELTISESAAPASSLFERDDGSFAVQLIAVRTTDELDNFTASHGLTNPEFVRIESQGDLWIIVLLGIYDTRDEATAAANNWFDSHQSSTRPWVRRLGPLKEAARRAGPKGA